MSENTARLHPMCGYSLQEGTKALAVANMMFSGLGLITCFMAVLEIGFVKAAIKAGSISYLTYAQVDFGVVLIILLAALLCIELALAVLLYYGAKEASYTKCQTWYMTSLFCWTLHFMLFGILVAGIIGYQLLLIVSLLTELVYQAYLIWVVYVLMQEIDDHTRTDGFETSISLIEVADAQF